jgi:hypothetical protein
MRRATRRKVSCGEGAGAPHPAASPCPAACGQLAVTRAIRTQLRRPVDNSVVDRFGAVSQC